MKLYFVNINSIHIIFSGAYYLLYLFLTIKVFRSFFNYKSNQLKIIIILFTLLSLIPLLDLCLDFLPKMPDTDSYSRIVSGDYSFSKEMGLSYYGFSYLTLIPRYISFNTPYFYIFFQISIFIISIGIYFEAWVKYYSIKDLSAHRNFFLTISCFWPASYYYIPVPLRESLFHLGFSLFLFGLARCKSNNKQINFALLVGLIIVFLIRVQSLYCILFIYSIFLVSTLKNFKAKERLLFLLFLSLSFYLLSYSISLKNIVISPKWLSAYRNYAIALKQSGNLGYGALHWVTWLDLLGDLPKLSLQFLLSPLPIISQKTPFARSILLIDSIYVSIILIFFLFSARNLLKKYTFWYSICFIFIIFNSIYEWNLSGAVRHRMPAIIMLNVLSYQLFKSFDLHLGKPCSKPSLTPTKRINTP